MGMEKYLAVSGLPGLYTLVTNRKNGLIIENPTNGKRQFVAARRHQFTPLESVAIYATDVESLEIREVFAKMDSAFETTPPPELNSSKEVLFDYFEKVFPTFDRLRVYPNDIKKTIKWFLFLKNENLIEDALTPTTEEQAKEEE